MYVYLPLLYAQINKPVYGVTVDNVKNLHQITEALERLPVKPTTRIVFDAEVPAKDYSKAVEEISNVSYVMGELLDSYYMKNYTVTDHKKRVLDYIETLDDYVDIWEIGNEINGDWLGPKETVIKKMVDAFNLVNDRGGKTALTLYYNKNCIDDVEYEMFNWVNKNVHAKIKQEVDYVFISYYEDDCNDYQPDWQRVFDSLHVIFPNSKLGIGECGTKFKDSKPDYMKRYYSMNITTPGYVGGYFWWYFRQDCVPYTKPLWSVLNQVLRAN